MPLPTVIFPGYFAAASDYRDLEKSLSDRGFPTVTVPLSQRDWWPTFGGRSMVPILRQLDRTVKQMLHQYAVPQVNLVGHSAGGWISRIYLGETPYTIHGDVVEDVGLWNAHPCVRTLITLGTPHVSVDRWTRKNLDFVKIHYPGAFHPKVRYVCVAGKSVFGKRGFGTWLAYKSYELTAGKGDTWGDGITPVEAALLDGAENLVLDGVWHSPRSPGKWYGSPDVLPVWSEYLC